MVDWNVKTFIVFDGLAHETASIMEWWTETRKLLV